MVFQPSCPSLYVLLILYGKARAFPLHTTWRIINTFLSACFFGLLVYLIVSKG